MESSENLAPARVVGRYALYAEIAAGGMATVHIGRLIGPVGFSRTVAIKRLHPQFAKDPEFVSMFLDEARLAARIRHPNVVPTLDVVATQGELFLVMDYVQGESLSRLIRGARERGQRIPPRIVATIMSGALHGLHAAHEARNERGEPLSIVHRDVSPQNILVGTDGVPRVLDFGVAKAGGRIQTTREGQLKGKLAYMAPEQLSGHVTRQTDIYAAAVVLWEALAGKRLFSGENEAAILGKVLNSVIVPPSQLFLDPSRTLESAAMHGFEELDKITLRGLDRDPTKRFQTAREMAIAVERCIGLASPSEVGEWVEQWASETLTTRAARIAEIESSSSVNAMTSLPQELMMGSSPPPPLPPPDRVSRTSGHLPYTLGDGSSSQLSSISLSKPGDAVSFPPPPRRTALAIILIVLAMTAMLAILATVIVLRKKPPEASTAKNDPTAIVPVAASAISSGDSIASDPMPTASASPIANTARDSMFDASAAIATAHAATHATSHATGTTIKKPPPVTTATTSSNCDPPWTIDPVTGRKKYKLECPL
ncbi:MAG: serine/threonine-protein kinase [Polyangiaceae bacterium]